MIPAQEEIDNMLAQELLDSTPEFIDALGLERKEQIRNGAR